MREALKNINNIRKRFTATFERYGSKKSFKGWPVKTLLFIEVKDRYGNVVADHIWFTTTKGFEKYEFKEGDKISFDARVRPYKKGYRGYRQDENLPAPSVDYRLSHPTKVVPNKVGVPGQLF